MDRPISLVALVTDFGLEDHYVGAMKAVMVSANPAIRFIDISHEVTPQNVREAGYLLWASYKFFPTGTIFVSVVDPGVGTRRKIVIARTKKYFFIAPDNALLDFIVRDEDAEIREVVVNKELLGKRSGEISSTFHGRDIFAPLAVYLSKRKNWKSISRRIYLRPPKTALYNSRRKNVRPVILHIDRFGNIVTSIVGRCIQGVVVNKSRIKTWVANYQSAPSGKPCLIIGSNDLVEIVVKNGNAAEVLSATVNSLIRVIGA